jgi:ParB family chromosome partitioning protein
MTFFIQHTVVTGPQQTSNRRTNDNQTRNIQLNESQSSRNGTPEEYGDSMNLNADQLERLRRLEAGETVLANCRSTKKDRHDEALINLVGPERSVYIGHFVRFNRLFDRPIVKSFWHNPFAKSEMTEEERLECIRRYKVEHLPKLLSDPDIEARIAELRGKLLICWCYPEHCHGEVLIEFLENGYGRSESVDREIVVNGSTVTIDPTFERLFPRKQKDIDAIAEDMGKNGFNMAYPLLLADVGTEDKVYLLDGHTRVLAAQRAGVEPIIGGIMAFSAHQDAVDYAIHIQRDRRNLTDADIASCIAVLDELKTAGRPSKELATHEANLSKGKSAESTATKLGTNRGKIEKTRAVLKNGTPEIKEAVTSGEKTINAAYNEIRGTKKPVTEDVEMISIPKNSPYKLTEIIRENYRPDQIEIIINILQRRMAA